MLRIFLTLSVWMLVSPIAAAAPIYKWTDAEGRVHYGERPPSGSNAEEMAPPKPVIPDRETQEHRVRRHKLLESMDKERALEAKQQRDAALREKRCLRAREQLKKVTAHGTLYENRPDGTRKALSDAERARAERSVRQAVRQLCGS